MSGLRLPLLVCAALACAIGAELLLPGDAPPEVARPAIVRRTGTAKPAPELDGWQDTALERPLFSRTRSPSDAEPREVDTKAMPRLTGVIVTPHGGRALFVGADGKAQVAREGDTIAQATVKSIAHGEVVLEMPGGEIVLHPRYDAIVKPPEKRL